MFGMNVINPRVGGGMSAFASNSLPPLRLPVRNEGDKIGAGLADLGSGIAKGIRARQARKLDEQKLAALQKYQQENQALDRDKFQEEQRQFDKKMELASKEMAAQESAQKTEAAAYAAISFIRMSRQDKMQNKDLVIRGWQQAGLMNDEEAEKARNAPIEQVEALAKKTALLSVNAMKMMAKDSGQKKGKEGATKIYDPQTGNLVLEQHPLTSTNVTRTQEKLVAGEETLSALDSTLQAYDDDLVGGSGAFFSTYYGARDWLSDIPIIGEKVGLNDKQRSWLKRYQNLATNTLDHLFAYVKEKSGVQYSDKQLEAFRTFLPTPEDSKTIFKQKAETLRNNVRKIQGLREKLLSEGYTISKDPNSPYAKEYLKRTQTLLTTPVNQEQGQANKRITVVSPDGVRGTVPTNQRDLAIEQGYKVIE